VVEYLIQILKNVVATENDLAIFQTRIDQNVYVSVLVVKAVFGHDRIAFDLVVTDQFAADRNRRRIESTAQQYSPLSVAAAA
jgi:hypothetical protein